MKQFAVKTRSVDTLSQFSVDSTTSADSKEPVYIAAGDIRKRLSEHFTAPKSKFEVISEVILAMFIKANKPFLSYHESFSLFQMKNLMWQWKYRTPC